MKVSSASDTQAEHVIGDKSSQLPPKAGSCTYSNRWHVKGVLIS